MKPEAGEAIAGLNLGKAAQQKKGRVV